MTFLLYQGLTSVTLCALHCEMRNTDQLLGSLGLFAYKCGSLDKCNEAISHYGPEISRGHDRITVKLQKTITISLSGIVFGTFFNVIVYNDCII